MAADPIRLSTRIGTCYPEGGDMDSDFALLQKGGREGDIAFARLVKLSRDVFGLADFAEDPEGKQSGVTDAEALSTLMDFSVWMEEVRGRFFSWRTPQNSTAPASSNGAEPPSATSASAASTSTGTDPSPEGAGPTTPEPQPA